MAIVAQYIANCIFVAISLSVFLSKPLFAEPIEQDCLSKGNCSEEEMLRFLEGEAQKNPNPTDQESDLFFLQRELVYLERHLETYSCNEPLHMQFQHGVLCRRLYIQITDYRARINAIEGQKPNRPQIRQHFGHRRSVTDPAVPPTIQRFLYPETH